MEPVRKETAMTVVAPESPPFADVQVIDTHLSDVEGEGEPLPLAAEALLACPQGSLRPGSCNDRPDASGNILQ